MIHDSLENNETLKPNTFWVDAFLDFVISLIVTQLIMYRNVF